MNRNKPVRIFIVEDDVSYRGRLIQNISAIRGCEIRAFATAVEFLHALSQGPDIIVMNHVIEGWNEDNLLIKTTGLLPGIPVIVFSGQTEITSVGSILKNGAYDFITQDENTFDCIAHSIEKIRQQIDMQSELNRLRDQLAHIQRTGHTAGNAFTGTENGYIRSEAPEIPAQWMNEDITLEEYNMRIIGIFLEKNKYNVVETARKLNVGKSTIYRYLKENKIRLPETTRN